jgi:CheY-like chemotaxis protein
MPSRRSLAAHCGLLGTLNRGQMTGAGCSVDRSIARACSDDRLRYYCAHLPQGGPIIKTLLVVDDDAAIRDALRGFLEGEGFRVVTAPNGQEALVLLRSEKPSCILLDLMMPIMNGAEFLDALRHDSEFHHTPILILSAWAHEQTAVIARADHIEVLPKPFNATALLESVRRCSAAKAGDVKGLAENHH